MTRPGIVPCIWLDDRAEQAAAFYVQTLPGARITAYPESSDNPGGRPRGSDLTVDLEVAGHRFTLLNGGPQFVPGIARWMSGGDAAARDRAFAAMPAMGKLDIAALERAWSGG